jgi:WD40 repeat protein
VAVTDGDDGKIYSILLFDAGTGKEQAALKAHALEITCLTFNSDGTLLATGGSDGTVKVWDMKTRKQSVVLRGYLEPRALAFSPDSKTLATVGRSEPVLGRKSQLERDNLDHGVVRLWDVGKGKERANLICFKPGSSGSLLDRLRFSPNGKRLCVRETFGPTYLWDMDAEQLVTDRIGGYAFVFSPDSKLLATSSDKHVIVFRDGETGKEKRVVEVKGEALAFSPNGGVLAVWTNNGIELVNVETGKSAATLKAVSTDAPHVVFSPDGKTLTALMRTDKEAAIKVWELTGEKEPAK